LGSAVTWAALTEADLVVRASGRIRPVSVPKKVYNAGRGEVFSGSVGGRVVEVNFKQGQEVRAGAVLIRLDTARLANEMGREGRVIRAAEDELVKGKLLAELAARQFEAARAKTEAEREQLLEEIRQAKARRVSDIRLARVEVEAAADEEGRLRLL